MTEKIIKTLIILGILFFLLVISFIVIEKYIGTHIITGPLRGIIAFAFVILTVFFITSGLIRELRNIRSDRKSKMVFENKTELKQYLQKKAFDNPRIKNAIKNRDLQFLLLLAKEYKDKGYWIEEAELLDEIVKLDPDGYYGQRAKELMEKGERMKDDTGRYLDENARNYLRKLEDEYIKELSPRTTLALAEAYRKYNMSKVAIMYYENILENFKGTPEARIAKQALSEIRANE